MTKKLLLTVSLAIGISMTAQNLNTAATTAGTLSVSVTTSGTGGGKYAPNHVIAIWVQDNTNKYVKTLLVNAQTRINELFAWSAVNPTHDRTGADATSGATSLSFGLRTCKWDGTNSANTQMADGTYTLKMELNDSKSAGKTGSFTFTKGTANSTGTLVGTAQSSFSNVSIQWVAKNTALNDVKLSTLYSIYPNPAEKSVYVNGPDIQSIEVVGLNGAQLLYSNNQLLNTSSLAKGVYMLNITTGKGLVSKKLIKN